MKIGKNVAPRLVALTLGVASVFGSPEKALLSETGVGGRHAYHEEAASSVVRLSRNDSGVLAFESEEGSLKLARSLINQTGLKIRPEPLAGAIRAEAVARSLGTLLAPAQARFEIIDKADVRKGSVSPVLQSRIRYNAADDTLIVSDSAEDWILVYDSASGAGKANWMWRESLRDHECKWLQHAQQKRARVLFTFFSVCLRSVLDAPELSLEVELAHVAVAWCAAGNLVGHAAANEALVDWLKSSGADSVRIVAAAGSVENVLRKFSAWQSNRADYLRATSRLKLAPPERRANRVYALGRDASGKEQTP